MNNIPKPKVESQKSESPDSAMGAAAPENNTSDSESDAYKRTNFFLRLTTRESVERDLGFGVFGKFRDAGGYRIGFEDQDSRGAAGSSGDKDLPMENHDGVTHDGVTHENYFMQFTSKKDK